MPLFEFSLIYRHHLAGMVPIQDKSFPKVTEPLKNMQLELEGSRIPHVSYHILSHSLKGFGQYTKHYHIEKYSEICLIHNCYVCNLTTPT